MPPAGGQSVSPKDIWDALEAAGASAVQAAGIMGNMISESSLNPEATVTDVNGHESVGLVQWNTAPGNYPQARSLVTGQPMTDMLAQIKFLGQTGGIRAASGSTPAQAAASFATGYERCVTCQSGGAQNTARQANAVTVAGWAAAGSWPASSGAASDQANLAAAGAAQTAATCWFAMHFNDPNPIPSGVPFVGNSGGQISWCVLSKSQARGAEGLLIMLGGIGLMGLGLILLMAGSDIARATTQRVAMRTPGVRTVSRIAAAPE